MKSKSFCSIVSCIYGKKDRNPINIPNHIKFFGFPTKSLEMCIKWAVHCEPNCDIKYAKVCSLHFGEEDIITSHSKSKRKTFLKLKESAVPIGVSSKNQLPFAKDEDIEQVEEILPCKNEDIVEGLPGSFCEEFVIENPTASNVDEDYSEMCIEEIFYQEGDDNTNAILEDESQVQDIKECKKTSSDLLDKIETLESKNKDLRQRLKSTNDEIANFERLDDNLKNIFTANQIKQLKSNKRLQWEHEDKLTGLALVCSVGRFTYRLLQSHGLPGLSCSAISQYKRQNEGIVQKIRDVLDSKTLGFRELNDNLYIKLSQSLRTAFDADCKKELSKIYKSTKDQKKTPCIYPDCPKLFENRLAMRKHMLLHKFHKYLCHECGMAFTTRNRLIRHSQKHTKKNARQNKVCIKN